MSEDTPPEERIEEAMEEFREALSTLDLARSVAAQAFRVLELARRLGEETDEAYRRSEEHFQRAFELLGIDLPESEEE